MESGFWCHPEIRQQTVSLDLQAELWKDLFCLRKFMRHWEAEGQLGGSGERPELLRVGLRQRWGGVLARFERPELLGVGLRQRWGEYWLGLRG